MNRHKCNHGQPVVGFSSISEFFGDLGVMTPSGKTPEEQAEIKRQRLYNLSKQTIENIRTVNSRTFDSIRKDVIECISRSSTISGLEDEDNFLVDFSIKVGQDEHLQNAFDVLVNAILELAPVYSEGQLRLKFPEVYDDLEKYAPKDDGDFKNGVTQSVGAPMEREPYAHY